MKIMTSPLPSWGEIFGGKTETEEYWKDVIWTKRSGVSIRLIAEETRGVMNSQSVNILIPNFFCGQTERDFDIDGVHVIHYPVTKTLDPDWNIIKNDFKDTRVDIFLFVHYFGVFHDPNRAKIFCKQHKAILIEDAAHCLYPYQKIGRAGDFVIFSSHKLLPTPDGAIIVVNHEAGEKAADVASNITARIKQSPSNSAMLIWRAKKAIQRIIKINKPYKYYRGVHYYPNENRNKPGNLAKSDDICISGYSRRIVQGYSYERLKQIAYIRRENYDLLKCFLREIDSNIEPFIPDDCECPYLAVFSLLKVEKKEQVIKRIIDTGIPVMFWPELPLSIKGEPDSEIAKKLSKDLITLPVHQDINPCTLVNHMPVFASASNKHVSIEKIETEEKKRWDDLYNRIRVTNITQHWSYGDVKSRADGWNTERMIISQNGRDIGILQLLSKKLFGRCLVYRVNKGPIFIFDENNIDLELAVMKQLWKKLSHPSVFFYVPFSFMSAENFIKTVKCGWKNWDIYGFPTGIVDLDKSEDEIRKSLNSKWRNQLKTSEKYEHIIKTDAFRFPDMLKFYEKEQKDKEFKGVSTLMLKAMNEHEESPLRYFYVEDGDGKLMAYDIFYKHGQTSTYYIGWNSEKGRKQYLNNFLLYHAAILLKEEGVKTLDLGGIEYIHTEEVAKFKDGMMPTHFRQMGEFIKIG